MTELRPGDLLVALAVPHDVLMHATTFENFHEGDIMLVVGEHVTEWRAQYWRCWSSRHERFLSFSLSELQHHFGLVNER